MYISPGVHCPGSRRSSAKLCPQTTLHRKHLTLHLHVGALPPGHVRRLIGGVALRSRLQYGFVGNKDTTPGGQEDNQWLPLCRVGGTVKICSSCAPGWDAGEGEAQLVSPSQSQGRHGKGRNCKGYRSDEYCGEVPVHQRKTRKSSGV